MEIKIVSRITPNFKNGTIELKTNNLVAALSLSEAYEISKIYETMCTAEYLFDNDDRLTTFESAYRVAKGIREYVDDICTCEDEMITMYADKLIREELGEKEDQVLFCGKAKAFSFFD